jgi:hypothetical protein
MPIIANNPFNRPVAVKKSKVNPISQSSAVFVYLANNVGDNFRNARNPKKTMMISNKIR